jgi:uncharacterized RDD family membrane protein YckC
MSEAQQQGELAGAGPRLLAYLIDLFWLFPLFLVLMLVASLVNGGTMSAGGELMANIIAALVVITFWAQHGATPGKRVLGLVIVDAATGGPVPIGRLVLRYVGYVVSAIPFCLGYLWMIWDARKQGWHDKMAGTLVVRLPR